MPVGNFIHANGGTVNDSNIAFLETAQAAAVAAAIGAESSGRST